MPSTRELLFTRPTPSCSPRSHSVPGKPAPWAGADADATAGLLSLFTAFATERPSATEDDSVTGLKESSFSAHRPQGAQGPGKAKVATSAQNREK